MPQNMKIDDEFLEGLEGAGELPVEEIPDVPKALKGPAVKGVKKAKTPKIARVKEFDIRAAHQAWKEKNGIEDDYFYR